MSEIAEWNSHDGRASKNTIVLFYNYSEENEALSKIEKRPIFEDKIHIKKIPPGDTNVVIDWEKRDGDELEFPEEWAAFQRKEGQLLRGTIIDSWGEVTGAQRSTLKAVNIFTVEHLAESPETVAKSVMGFFELQRKARHFLKVAKDVGLLEKKEEELTAMKEMLEKQSILLADLERRLPKKSKKLQKDSDEIKKEVIGDEST